MTSIEYIKQKFAYIGVISDVGASAFANDNNIALTDEVTEEAGKEIGIKVDAFVEKYIMRPSSVSEAGFSMSWSSEQIKNHARMMMKKYDIKPTSEVASALGLRVIKNVSSLW